MNLSRANKIKLMRLALVLVIAGGVWLYDRISAPPDADITLTTDSALFRAIENQQSDVQVSGQGRVIKTLRDDNEGSRHQRFLLELENGHVILIAHNIDLAPRLDGLRKNDRVGFNGEFEWNNKGGVVHWTHHDPKKRHPDGWLELDGRIYQ